MSFSFFSAIMAMVCGSVIILVIHLLRKKSVFLKRFGVSTVLLLYAICAFRLLFAFEFPFTKVVEWREGLNGLYRTIYLDKVQISDFFEVNIAGSFVILWLVLALVFTIVFIAKYITAQRKARVYAVHDQLPDAMWILEEIKRNLNSKLDVTICYCPLTDVPISLGIWNKLILLPKRQYSIEKLKCILMHEYIHHCNHDLLLIFLVRQFCCLFWWNPLVYLLRNDVLQMLEIKCDLTVTQGMDKDHIVQYLTTIVEALKGTEKSDPALCGSATLVETPKMKKDISVVERFKMITQPSKGNPKVLQVSFILIFAAIFFASYLFILQSAWDPSEKEITEGGKYVEIDTERAYLLKQKDGTWSYVLPDGTVTDISEETANIFIADGDPIKEE